MSQNQRHRDFERLAARYRKSAYAAAYRLLADATEAEDVTQEGFVRAWLHFDSYDANRSFETWMLRIVRNLAIDAYRRRKRQRWVSLEGSGRTEDDGAWMAAAFTDRSADPQSRILARATTEQLMQTLSQLPALHREVLWLLHVEEGSYETISGLMGCPVGTVRSRAFRARKAVLKALQRADSLQ
jgi:RNA polymerase sigma-70 factor (ECF subfamily)